MIARFRAAVAALALALVAPLLGASTGFAPPVVIVYPITSTGGVEASVGGNIALAFATKLAELGGVTVKPAIPGTERAKFLDVAAAEGADYYITGFLTPIGAESSLIAQIVSTHSGSVVFSTTTTVRTYADAVAQVDTLRAAILRHAGRGLAALDAPPPAPSSAPTPGANDGSRLDIGKALRKRKRSSPTPSPKPVAAPTSLPGASVNANSSASASASATGIPTAFATANPTSRVATSSPIGTPAPTVVPTARRAETPASRASAAALLFVVEGALAPPEIARTMRALVAGFARAKRPTTLLGEPLGSNLSRAADICTAHAGATELDAATMLLGKTRSGAVRVQLDLSAYDCNGVRRRTHRAIATATGRNALRVAIVRAATEATSAIAAR